MKHLMLIALLSLSFAAQSKPVNGKIVYQLPNGELIDRELTIKVPSRGKGEVVLSGKNFEWKTTNFWSFNKKKETKFLAAFQTEFMGQKSTILFKGTYLKGSNKILYYGSFYKVKGFEEVDAKSKLSQFRYTGAFKFEYDR